jgi:hypothetical protein
MINLYNDLEETVDAFETPNEVSCQGLTRVRYLGFKRQYCIFNAGLSSMVIQVRITKYNPFVVKLPGVVECKQSDVLTDFPIHGSNCEGGLIHPLLYLFRHPGSVKWP